MAKRSHEFATVVTKEAKWYVAHCPELDIASQGRTIEEALKSLREAIELYLEDEHARAPKSDQRPLVTVVKVLR